ncbi:LuxR C-terminal-related transcriptional regulator [Algihabitans albus]|uniref:LuxR C-terminal-related transcriptional regulator n=1 Tax=Algihabitans albus TaxID=2164067 RepID=UPI000E5CD238|nr:response regulator transcription factor [Algihabitans albus]
MGTVQTNSVVVLVSQNTLFRAGLASLLLEMELGEIVQAVSLTDLHNCGRLFEDDGQMILLIDVSGQRENAVDLVTRGRGYFENARIVLMTNDINIDTMSRCFAAGLDGYLLEDISQQSLADSLRLLRLGEKVFPSRLASIIVDYSRQLVEPQICMERIRAHNLSDREAQVLRCLVNGDSNKLIARRLEITESTVKVHLKSILKKTDAGNRTQAAIWALKRSSGPDSSKGLAAASLAAE